MVGHVSADAQRGDHLEPEVAGIAAAKHGGFHRARRRLGDLGPRRGAVGHNETIERFLERHDDAGRIQDGLRDTGVRR
jgi:hypothetical protein